MVGDQRRERRVDGVLINEPLKLVLASMHKRELAAGRAGWW